MAAGGDLWNEQADSQDTGDAKARPVAVALAWDGSEAPPRVVATGKGFIAEQILNFAFAHGVKVRTDPDLAQVLAAVEIDTVIPAEAFVAVAEILAYVYRANGWTLPASEAP